MRSIIVLGALAMAIASPVWATDLPPAPETQSINCTQDGPKACQRLKALRNLFGPEASSVPLNCHFSLVATPEDPNPRYRAKNLALVCVTGGTWGGGGVSTLYWSDGAAGGNVLTDSD